MAAQLPQDLARYVERAAVRSDTDSEFWTEEFYRKVAERQESDVTPEVARAWFVR